MTTLPDMAALWQQTLGWQPDVHQQGQFQCLYDQILTGNRQLNLTRITAPEEFWEKHLWDSLAGIRLWLRGEEPSVYPDIPNAQVIDIGTGAGFPGLPVAIARPDWQVTLLDSTQKKVEFLKQVREPVGLPQVTPLVGRAEAIGQQPQHREHYNLALIRAVAAVTVCVEYTLPLLDLGGMAILYRGQWTDAEQQDLERSVAPLGGAIARIEAFQTPLTGGVRHCVYLEKIRATPKAFPRSPGVPAQKPL